MVEVRPVHLLILCGGLSAGALSLGVVFLVLSHQGSDASLSSQQDLELLSGDSIESPVPSKSIVVDIEGAVVHPGIVRLSIPVVRLTDVIQAAGGFAANADIHYVATKLNLAEVLRDGMKLYIPVVGEQGVVSGISTDDQSPTINVNTASLDQLSSLQGIGSVRAQAIIDHRPYTSVSDLQTKAKLGKATIDGIEANISF